MLTTMISSCELFHINNDFFIKKSTTVEIKLEFKTLSFKLP